jgi:hypothetical protein
VRRATPVLRHGEHGRGQCVKCKYAACSTVGVSVCVCASSSFRSRTKTKEETSCFDREDIAEARSEGISSPVECGLHTSVCLSIRKHSRGLLRSRHGFEGRNKGHTGDEQG